MLGKFAFVGIELFFEERYLTFGLAVFYIAQLRLVLVFLLLVLVKKVLLLSFDDDC